MNDNTIENPIDELEEHEILAIRKEKLDEMRKHGEAFPNDFRRQHLSADLIAQYDALSKEDLAETKPKVVVAGRMMLRRIMGKASFAHIQDPTSRIQLYVRRDDLPEGIYADFKKWDIGDILGAEGYLFKTKTGELSVHVESIRLLTKSLRPLPDKFHGLTDVELRYRQRYVDLIMNEQSRKVFQIRSKLVSTIREFMNSHDFMEVETPMMQPIPGGASAKPFITHHNTLDMTLYLRIAPELFLKRLVVGGFDRVYEINRNFRNEGISTRHNPEFTMLEFYQAYADFNDLIDFTESMMRYCADKVLGTTEVNYQGATYDFGKPFHRFTMKQAIVHFNPEIDMAELEDDARARALAAKLGIALRENDGLGKVQLEIFEKTTEHLLMEPTFITAYPTEVSPLARRNADDPDVTDRFEFFIHGRELANGFSELNDPEDQAERFLAQVKERDEGDEEAMHFDADYINALEYGMPPTAGEGIGIDRLAMLFTDAASIRDVILFPQLRKHD